VALAAGVLKAFVIYLLISFKTIQTSVFFLYFCRLSFFGKMIAIGSWQITFSKPLLIENCKL